jgi:hypothetical protein
MSIPPLRGGDFQGIRVYRSDVFLGRARKANFRVQQHRLDEPTKLSLGMGRGRDEHRCPPPAQIRTSGLTAYGSSLGYERQSGHRVMDEECGDEESTDQR